MEQELKEALSLIADASYLHEKCQKLLELFSIKYVPVSPANLPVDAFLELKFISNEHNQPLIRKIREICVVGIATQDTFLTGNTDGMSVDEFKTNINNDKYQEMAFFSIDANEHMTRTEIATLTRAFNRRMVNRPVVLFVRSGALLSMATCERTDYVQSGHRGQKAGRVTILRDIDCRNPHRGHLDILCSLDLSGCKSYDELYARWLNSFSNELLTKKFYSELSDWYAWAVQEAKFPNDLSTTADDAKFNHESCIRLITRLIFVWFLKQKKLIPEEFFDEQYICENLIAEFNPHERKTLLYNAGDSKYYRLVLQNLFFAMLNRPIVAEDKTAPNNRRFRNKKTYHGIKDDYDINNLMRYEDDFMPGGAEKFMKLANTSVPFLNGGLFDCLDDKPSKLYYDGFSECKASLEQLSLPDYLFFGDEVGRSVDLSKWYDDKTKKSVSACGLIDILKRYSFTIEENTPLDQEVSLDPELLGKVFENLLASFNPETKTSARKQTGSFYTPREIVQYMVDESLVAHLKRVCGGELETQYRELLSYNADDVDFSKELSPEQRQQIMRALYNCRVLDPACGSGAFPMGMLQQMVHVLKRIDPTNKMWNQMMVDLTTEAARRELEKATQGGEQERQMIEDNRQARLDDIESAFNQSINDPDYARKLYLIEHCIYGVDIQPIATQISKLRFFISLVVDQKPTADPKKNFGIRPLPNLEAKFVTANTLIPLDRKVPSDYCGDFFDDDAKRVVGENEQKLRNLNHQLFLAKRYKEKKKLREQMAKIREQMANQLKDLGFIDTSGYAHLVKWDMFDQNASAPFFDPDWMFGVKNGFDVVIGNPPYVQLSSNGGKLAKVYESYGYQTMVRTGDLYCLFYEGAHRLLKQGGHLCFITSNKWMRAAYGEKMRQFFATQTNPELLIDFAGVKVFESATVETNILLYSKAENGHRTVSAVTNKQNADSVKNLSVFVQQNSAECSFDSSDSWVILSPIEQCIKRKIESVGTPLKDWDINIYRGVLTGCNEAFIISTERRNKILAKCQSEEERQRTEELIRPILRGRDIKRYGYDWAELWLINTHNGVKGKFPRINIEDYPAVKAWLDKGGTAYNGKPYKGYAQIKKRADQGDTPYNLRNCAYLEDFNKPKIVWGEISDRSKFAIEANGRFIPEATTFIMVGKDLPYLLCVMNSPVSEWFFSKVGTTTGVGTVRWKKYTIQELLIPKVSAKDVHSFEKLVREFTIGNISKDEVCKYANQLLYDILGLSDEEVEYVENFYPPLNV